MHGMPSGRACVMSRGRLCGRPQLLQPLQPHGGGVKVLALEKKGGCDSSKMPERTATAAEHKPPSLPHPPRAHLVVLDKAKARIVCSEVRVLRHVEAGWRNGRNANVFCQPPMPGAAVCWSGCAGGRLE